MIDLGPFADAAGYEEAIELDRSDPLADRRADFLLADPDLLYLDGNSLGALPLAAIAGGEDATRRQWGERLVRAWGEGWWDLQLRLGDLLAPVLGARRGEIVISDSTSVNLFKLALAALGARPDRTKIVTDDLNFPTDIYVLQGVVELLGDRHSIEVVPSDGIHGPLDGLAAAIDDTTALVTLSHTAFKSGYTYDMAAITEQAHAAGAMVLWDCSHSVGALPIDLSGSNSDLAVGCCYKYLNGGPGAPAFLYVRSELQDQLTNPITAWWGHAEPFAFDLDFAPTSGIRRFHTGTMPVLSLAAAEAGITGVVDAGIEAIRAKSIGLTEFAIRLWSEHLAPIGFRLGSPLDPTERGSHVSLTHPEAWRITRALVDEAKVIPDFREPDNLRLGLSPLYISHLDVHSAVLRIRTVVDQGTPDRYPSHRTGVT